MDTGNINYSFISPVAKGKELGDSCHSSKTMVYNTHIHVTLTVDRAGKNLGPMAGSHATLPPKKQLLTSEQHSFHGISQPPLLFHFQEHFCAKFAL